MMINDRLHILDRMSQSMNSEDNKPENDFSDVHSIKYKKKNSGYNPYQLRTRPEKKEPVININTKVHTQLFKKNIERSRANTGNWGVLYPNKSSKGDESEENMSEDFKQYYLDSSIDHIQSFSPSELKNEQTILSRNNSMREYKVKSAIKYINPSSFEKPNIIK